MFGFLCYFVILQCMLFHVLQGNLSLKIPRIITVYSFDSLCSLVKLQLSSYSLVNCEVQRIWVALSFCFYSFHLLFFSTVMSPSNVAVLCLRNPSFFFFFFLKVKMQMGWINCYVYFFLSEDLLLLSSCFIYHVKIKTDLWAYCAPFGGMVHWELLI